MDFLPLAIVMLGLAVIVCFLYLILSGATIPPAFRLLVLIAVVLMCILCLAHTAGCHVTPQQVGGAQ
jgi:peptidoglycan/LPS O-acetylase OafA/YrhL